MCPLILCEVSVQHILHLGHMIIVMLGHTCVPYNCVSQSPDQITNNVLSCSGSSVASVLLPVYDIHN